MSFSRSGATSKNISWLSLIIPNDANQIKNNLDEFAKNNHILFLKFRRKILIQIISWIDIIHQVNGLNQKQSCSN